MAKPTGNREAQLLGRPLDAPVSPQRLWATGLAAVGEHCIAVMLYSLGLGGWCYGQCSGARRLRLSGAIQLYSNSNDLSSVISDVVHSPNVLDTLKDEFIDSLSFVNVSPHVTDGLQVVEMRCGKSK